MLSTNAGQSMAKNKTNVSKWGEVWVNKNGEKVGIWWHMMAYAETAKWSVKLKSLNLICPILPF